jgi:CHAT domain-containing protein
VVKSVEVPVGEPRIREAVNQFRQLLQTPTSSLQAVQSQGKLLYDWLIKPVEPELNLNKIQNLVFSLDRSARYIPMAALFDGANYLVEKYSISTVLSAGLTDTESRLPAGTANTKVLGLGLSRPVAGFNALPNVPAELDVIIRNSSGDQKGIYPGKAFLNAEFDYRALRDNLQGHNILHIATHGVFVPGKQDDSYLVLGTGEKLPIPRIDNLEDLSDVHLVVLSACETALGETAKDGVEIPGVSFYFLNRRAKAVMASLWLVDDASTRILMEQFYASAASDPRPTKAQALRAAQLSLLGVSNGSGQASAQRGLAVQGRQTSSAPQPPTGVGYSHPYYWAPFILIGNGL